VKILAISCSPRKRGNTEILLGEALKGAKQEGAEVELYSVSGKTIAPCDDCRICRKTGKCRIKDDMQELYDKLLEANGIIFGTPIYFHSMTAQAKTVMDRTFALDHEQIALANKVGGIIAVGGSLGLIDAIKDFLFYFAKMQMLPANFVAAYALNKGEVRNLPKGMKAAKDLGRQVALLVAKKFEYPKEIQGAHYGYGTWVK
jgi:multimeric flavodoxin WrbA